MQELPHTHADPAAAHILRAPRRVQTSASKVFKLQNAPCVQAAGSQAGAGAPTRRTSWDGSHLTSRSSSVTMQGEEGGGDDHTHAPHPHRHRRALHPHGHHHPRHPHQQQDQQPDTQQQAQRQRNAQLAYLKVGVGGAQGCCV